MGFFSTSGERMETAARLAVPYSLLALLFLLGVVAVSYPFGGAVKAPVFLMGLYYWAIYRPMLVPPWLAFLAGCLMDTLSGLPIGLTALVYIGIQWLATDQRRFLMGQNFIIIWFCFSLLSLAGFLVQWLLFGLMSFEWPPLRPLWMSSLLGTMVFPLVYLFLHMTHKVLPSPYPPARFGS